MYGVNDSMGGFVLLINVQVWTFSKIMRQNDINQLRFRLQHSLAHCLSLSFGVSKLQWLAHTRPDTSSSSLHVFWRMLVFTILMKHIAWWAEWSLLAALKTWQCKMAANWEHLNHYEDRKSL